MGFQLKLRFSAVLAVFSKISVGLANVVTQGNITATIIWFGIVTGEQQD